MSKKPNAPGRGSRSSGPVGFIRDLPIWTKLGLIMIVPTIATIVVGTAGLVSQVDQASAAARASSLATLSGDADSLVHVLQYERASAIKLLLAPPAAVAGAKTEYAKTQQDAQAALAHYMQTRATVADLPANLSGRLAEIQAGIAQLDPRRKEIAAANMISVTMTEPAMIKNIWTRSVYSTARRPPAMV